MCFFNVGLCSSDEDSDEDSDDCKLEGSRQKNFKTVRTSQQRYSLCALSLSTLCNMYHYDGGLDTIHCNKVDPFALTLK